MYDNIVNINGNVKVFNNFYSIKEADNILEHLLKYTPWYQSEVIVYGKTYNTPRLICLYGDKEYTYSGVTVKPEKWSSVLLLMKEKIEYFLNTKFNVVLLNLYRDGNDSIGMHSDNEIELGINPTIPSISFGVSRQFILKHKYMDLKVKHNTGHGDLLVMSGELQKYWNHGIPKEKTIILPRINLTFRKININ